MSKYQKALDSLYNHKLNQAMNPLVKHKNENVLLLQNLIDTIKKPYANDKGGYSCRGCDCDVFLRNEICYICDMELDWSDET